MEALTGAPLTGDAWVAVLEESTEDKVAKQKSGYEAALKLGPKIPAGALPCTARLTGIRGREPNPVKCQTPSYGRRPCLPGE